MPTTWRRTQPSLMRVAPHHRVRRTLKRGQPSRPMPSQRAAWGVSMGSDQGQASNTRERVSVPLAIFPVGAIVAIAILGALAGPLWASTGAAFCVTALGMWVARVGQSVKAALLAGTVGLLATASLVAISYRAAESTTTDLRAQDSSPKGAHLGGVDLSGTDLRRTDLRGADLRAADFTKACLRAADLRGADLRDAIFTNSDVAGSLTDGTKQTAVARNWPKTAPVPSPCDR